MKAIRILRRNIRDAFKSVFRNFSLSIASITCIIITLVLVSVGIILSRNVNSFISDLQKELTIVAYSVREATVEDNDVLRIRIEYMEAVESVVHSTKEEVRIRTLEEDPFFEPIMSTWTPETNPLSDEFKIKVTDVEYIKDVVAELEALENIDTVTYGETVADRVMPVFRVIERFAGAIVIALILVTAFLISNTIKLTIFARKNEIEIMRLVGTSNLVIRLPFLFEGLILGIIGSIIPIIASIYGYIYLYGRFEGVFFSNAVRLVEPNPFVFNLAIWLVCIGGIVGMVGSYRAVRKYLKI